jgi:hypothetical protein
VKIFTLPAGQSCRSALNSWAAQQRHPTQEVEVLVLQPGAAATQLSLAKSWKYVTLKRIMRFCCLRSA